MSAKWFSMKRAPQDGTRVWAFFPDAQTTQQHETFWRSESPSGWQVPNRYTGSHGFDAYGQPTHWMPLPQPPAAPERIAPRETSGLTTE